MARMEPLPRAEGDDVGLHETPGEDHYSQHHLEVGWRSGSIDACCLQSARRADAIENEVT